MIRIRDLKDQIGTTGPRAVLHCDVCDSECSANAGDYYAADPDYVIQCCGEPMKLGIKKIVWDNEELIGG